MPRLTLIGYRGTGKTTVARLLADRLGCRWLDADMVLEQRVGRTIAELVRERGEAAFRTEESALLPELLREADAVLATGGGVVLAAENRTLLRRSGRPVAWLDAPAGILRARLAADPATADRRPALAGSDPLAEVATALEHRAPLYRACADAVFDSARESPARLAERIADWLAAGAASDAEGER